MENLHLLSLSLLVVTLTVSLNVINGVEYFVTNNAELKPGGIKFKNQIGPDFSKQTLISATNFIWNLFQQKTIEIISLIIEDMDGIAYTMNNEIHVSSKYINGYAGDLKKEYIGVLYHEVTRIWQWNGNGKTPIELIEGIADFVRLRAGYDPSHWVKAVEGDNWDLGYDITARFLDYCNGLRNGSVSELNKKMRDVYHVNYFVEILGNNVDQLWRDYKAKYEK